MAVRSGEPDCTWYRSNRFIHTADGWYFLTREGTQEGPFKFFMDAKIGLDLYKRCIFRSIPLLSWDSQLVTYL